MSPTIFTAKGLRFFFLFSREEERRHVHVVGVEGEAKVWLDPRLELACSHGLWLLVDGREHFLPFDAFPWFRNATVAQLSRIERHGADHLHWPDLDIDLSLQSIEHPEDYPLVSRMRSDEPQPGQPDP